MTRAFNFSAGPAALPAEVLAQAAEEMLDWHGAGMGVMEMSHRGREFMSILAQAQADLRELLAVPDNYRILFMQGGALAENALIPMNLLGGERAGERRTADYVVTGSWSVKSQKEARKYCDVNIAASTEAEKFTRLPTMEIRLTCISVRMKPFMASSISGRPIWAPPGGRTCRSWRTSRRTFFRVRWMCRSSA